MGAILDRARWSGWRDAPAGRRAALTLAVYTAAAIVVSWPLAASLTSHLGALHGPGDPYLNLWILGWGLEAWTTDPASVLSGRVFDANIFHPARGTLAYSDHFLLQALALAPVYAWSHDAVLCYNLLLLTSIALSGVAMHVFVRGVTGSEPAAWIAGVAWACWPYRTAHLAHIQLQALYVMPLAMLALHRLLAGRRWRDTAALGGAAALQVVASVYYGLIAGVMLVVAGVTLAAATGQWRARRLWGRLAAAAGMTVLACLPVLVPYARSQQAEGFGRTLFEAGNHSAAWQSYTQVPEVNLVYGRTGLLDPRAPAPGARDRRSVEHQLFPGLVIVGLALYGVLRHRASDARPLVLSSVALVVAGVLLSFGPDGWRALYAALHDNVYGFQAIRAPARFAVMGFFGVAVCAALGMRALIATRLRSPIAMLIPLLLGLEYLNAPLPLAAAPPRTTAVGQWLASAPAPGPVLYLPLGIDSDNTPYMVQSLEHRRPIVNGYSGQRPAFFTAVADSLASFPSPAAFATLRELDVRFVVSPSAVAGAGGERSPLVERARLREGIVYEVRWTPAALSSLEDLGGPPPPPPGPVPFAPGEVATYEVFWDGGPVDVPAGTVTLRVEAGSADDPPWRFEVRAETADWVSTFFQARDRFVTVADGRLLPLVHAREIREGRRAVDRTYVYDHDSRTVRVGASRDEAAAADALTLPLESPEARDAVTALYYVRTLPWPAGTTHVVPLNEAGASLLLLVAAGENESIVHSGRATAAVRLEPRVMRRLERRRPAVMTVWLSADERRIPLRALVEAGFGRVRLELTHYQQ